MKRRALLMSAGGSLAAPALCAAGPAPVPAECIVPAKAGGGFDLTCRLAQRMLAGERSVAMRYLPGGIGAVAYATMIAQRPAEPSTLVAFSSGSLLNLAQGKFGPYTEADVRWLAVVGTDYGVIVVRRDAPYRNLGDLQAALRDRLHSVVFGAGGTIGSQDWFKAALLAKATGVSHKSMRFVAFEGGGDALAALRGGHVSAVMGDAGELSANGDDVRVLAVLSERRLTGALGAAPTAREQGVDIVWPTARGFYLGPRVGDAAYREWVDLLRRAAQRESFASALAAQGLHPLTLFEAELQSFIQASMTRYRRLIAEFDLVKR